MPLTIAERKHRMPYGAQRAVATEHAATEAYVSMVMADLVQPKTLEGRKKLRRVQVSIARKLGVTVDEAFPPEVPQTNQDAAPLQAAS